MNKLVRSKLPTIYADLNVFRYIAYGEISIEKPERFKWVYSHVHLNEMKRNGNTDALKGMKILNAVEIKDVLNEKFEAVENIVLSDFIDPELRYEHHQQNTAAYEGFEDFFVEQLIHSYGADNFKELSLTPETLREKVDLLTSGLDDKKRSEMLQKANEVSIEWKEVINTKVPKRMPIDNTRKNLGLKSSLRKEIEKSDSPIDKLWESIGPSMNGVTKDQFFGFEPIPGNQTVQITQNGSIAGAHTILNMIGFSPDKGLSKRDKIMNIMSDGQHVGMASYCNALLSADRNICNKAYAIYDHINSHTNVLWFKFEKGKVIKLEVNDPATKTQQRD